jgi:hypothetical protein
MSTIPTVIFNYRVDDILEEITKRTSYTGKMRRSEQEPFLVDRLSLTRGEDFMFSEFLEEAVSETYDWVRAFGRNIPMYDKIVLKYSDIPMYKDYGASCKNAVTNEEYNFDSIIKAEIDELLEEDENTLFVSHDDISVTSAIEDVEVVVEHKLNLHTVLNGIDVVTTLNYNRSKLANKGDSVNFQGEQIPFNFVESDGKHEIKGAELYITIKVKPVVSTAIKKGTYVEYRTDFSDDSVFDVYQVTVDCTTADWMDYACKQAVDPRGCVIFILERTDHMDLNLISSIDRNIKEALINYIIYKWFEYTNVEEADKFYLKFDYHGQKAQIDMNSETKIVQRKYNINH